MMKPGHLAASAPIGLSIGWIAGTPLLTTLQITALTMYSSIWCDWDHPRLKNRENHIGAAAIRGMCKYGYRCRTSSDKIRDDYHRGPTHCIEWCILIGLFV